MAPGTVIWFQNGLCNPVEAFPHFWITDEYFFSFPLFFFSCARKEKLLLIIWPNRAATSLEWGLHMNQWFSTSSSFHLPAGLLDTLVGSETSQWRQWDREIGAAETAAMRHVYWGFILFSQGDIRDRYYLKSSPSGSAPIKGILSRKAVKAAIRTLVWLFSLGIFSSWQLIMQLKLS